MGSEANYRAKPKLIQLTDDIAHTLDRRKQADLILDFSKAFDKVPHRRLAHKLDWYGVRNKSLAWITAFLKDRTQRVLLDGETSTPRPVTSGVPQGTVLGRVLFLAYINDLHESITNSNVRLFADDCVLYRDITDRTTPTFYNNILTHLGDGRQVADGIQRRQVLCRARNSLQTQNTTPDPVHTTQPSTHTCQTLQIPRSNPLRRPNLAHPHIQRSRWRLQSTQLPPHNSPHRISKHQSP